jgi:hypothetical protein
MKLITLSALLIFSNISFAQLINSPKPAWTCFAKGKQGFGGPIGDIWITVRGQGETDLAAADDAVQNCLGQGLQMCSVDGCRKN